MLRCAAPLESAPRSRCDGSHQYAFCGRRIEAATRELTGGHNHCWPDHDPAWALLGRAFTIFFQIIVFQAIGWSSCTCGSVAGLAWLCDKEPTGFPLRATDSLDGESSPATYMESRRRGPSSVEHSLRSWKVTGKNGKVTRKNDVQSLRFQSLRSTSRWHHRPSRRDGAACARSPLHRHVRQG